MSGSTLLCTFEPAKRITMHVPRKHFFSGETILCGRKSQLAKDNMYGIVKLFLKKKLAFVSEKNLEECFLCTGNSSCIVNT